MNAKKRGELWSKIIDLIRSVTKKSNDYEEKYVKIKFNSNDKLPANKTIRIPIIIIELLFESKKCYPQVKMQVKMD